MRLVRSLPNSNVWKAPGIAFYLRIHNKRPADEEKGIPLLKLVFAERPEPFS